MSDPCNLSGAVVKLAYRVLSLKPGLYEITLLKRANDEMDVVVTERGKVESLKGSTGKANNDQSA